MPAQRSTNSVSASRWATRRQNPHPADRRSDGTPRVVPGVYLLTRAASPQFGKPITVRVIRELTERQTYHGWTWVDCYQLDRNGDATEKRQLFVRPDGLRPVRVPPRRRNAARASE